MGNLVKYFLQDLMPAGNINRGYGEVKVHSWYTGEFSGESVDIKMTSTIHPTNSKCVVLEMRYCFLTLEKGAF